MKMPVAGGSETQVVPAVSYRGFAPAGKGVYFIRREDGGEYAIQFLNETTGNVREVQQLTKPLWYYLSVSPDEQYVLWTQADQSGSDVMIEEVAADKGYHKASTLELSDDLDMRTYIPEPKRDHDRNWEDKPAEQQRSVYNNRRRMKRAKGKRLGRLRSERVERTFAHICESGGARRTWLTKLENVTKRYLIAAAAHNLGRILFKLLGIGKPKALQGEGGSAESLAELMQSAVWRLVAPIIAVAAWLAGKLKFHRRWAIPVGTRGKALSSTGC